MCVKSPDWHWNAGFQSQLLCPEWRKIAGNLVGRRVLAVEFLPDARKQRIHLYQKLFCRKAAQLAFHIHLWPIAHVLRFTFFGSVMPHSVAATMSQCSNAETNSSRLSGLCRSQCSSFENPHSDEYTPPHHSTASKSRDAPTP